MMLAESDRSRRGRSRINVVVRALHVLNTIAAAPAGMTLQQLHEALGIPLASLHRVLSTLEDEGYLRRSATTLRYMVGPQIDVLSQVREPQGNVLTPPDSMIALAERTGLTVFLTQLIDGKVLCTALIESRHHLRLYVRVGQEMPLHAAASARSILAHRDPGFVESLLTQTVRQSFTAGTPREINEVIDRLAVVRQAGFDVCSSELDEGVWAVSAPVRGPNGRADFALTAAAAASHVPNDAMRAQLVRQVMEAAASITAESGAPTDTPTCPPLPLLERLFATHPTGHPMDHEIYTRGTHS